MDGVSCRCMQWHLIKWIYCTDPTYNVYKHNPYALSVNESYVFARYICNASLNVCYSPHNHFHEWLHSIHLLTAIWNWNEIFQIMSFWFNSHHWKSCKLSELCGAHSLDTFSHIISGIMAIAKQHNKNIFNMLADGFVAWKMVKVNWNENWVFVSWNKHYFISVNS